MQRQFQIIIDNILKNQSPNRFDEHVMKCQNGDRIFVKMWTFASKNSISIPSEVDLIIENSKIAWKKTPPPSFQCNISVTLNSFIDSTILVALQLAVAYTEMVHEHLDENKVFKELFVPSILIRRFLDHLMGILPDELSQGMNFDKNVFHLNEIREKKP